MDVEGGNRVKRNSKDYSIMRVREEQKTFAKALAEFSNTELEKTIRSIKEVE